jgi:hypothetical protein
MSVGRGVQSDKLRHPHGQGWCTNCDRLPKDADRYATRRHAQRTGHITQYVVKEITTYRRVEKPLL